MKNVSWIVELKKCVLHRFEDLYTYIYANMDDMDTLHYQYGYMDTCEDVDLCEIVRVYLNVKSICTHWYVILSCAAALCIDS